MDFAYSPHRETGGTMHLPSPTHHGYRMEGAHFSSLQQLRRSLSRSPSKPSRFQLRTGKTDSPGSPISPLALARAFSPKPHKPASPATTQQDSTFGSQTTQPTKKKFTLRRSAPFRSSPRNRNTTQKSPRRALVDSTDLGNSTPFVARPMFGEENTPARKSSAEFWEKNESRRFDIDDKPIKFEFSRSQQQNSNAPGANCFTPAQPSPLKRRDPALSFDSANSETPNPKRRSLHGGFPSGSDFNIFEHFEQTPAPRTSTEETQRPQDNDPGHIFSTPAAKNQSPLRKNTAIRRTVSQRNSTNSPRPKSIMDGEFARPGLAASKTRQRASMDGFFLSGSVAPESPFARPTAHQPFMRGGTGGQQRHPLSNALTASSSSSSLGDESPAHVPAHPAAPKKNQFSRSLPIVGSRAQPPQGDYQPEGPFATPYAMKMAQFNQGPLVRSTGGLISKKNRNVDSPQSDKYRPPETPSKRNSYPPAFADQTPLSNKRGSLFGDMQKHSQPQFGTASTHASQASSESFGKGVGIFGSFGDSRPRRGSFLSINGDDDDNSNSPSGNHMTDSQSSADDMPPTPTKHSDGAGRRSKESSLRRKTFRQRASVGTETFTAPLNPEIDIGVAYATDKATTASTSPHTPNESFAPPDPSRLSISGQRRGSFPFNTSFGSFGTPTTPTTPRDHSLVFANGHATSAFGLPKNDVDESLVSRFHDVQKLGGDEGEFSQMFLVSQPYKQNSPHPSPPGSQFWVVKKSKKPIAGTLDRKRKMREVDALRALRGNEHVVAFEDAWEENQHLYIQTEHCEGGNLRRFLNEAGFKSRLDDFRIWKILLELSLGLKFIHERGFIHLDMKPANILIDFEGVLKIADFGLAVGLPAPAHFDGEGDRHYLAPEALRGRFEKASDVFALGMMLAEIASNCVIPENGTEWQLLRSGEFANVLPSLTWSEETTLSRDLKGDPIPQSNNYSADSLLFSDNEPDSLSTVHVQAGPDKETELRKAPNFMVDNHDPYALDRVVGLMLQPEPENRPTAEDIYLSYGCQWVAQRRRAGATIYEGNFGPSDDVLASFTEYHDIDAADMMDTS